VFEPKQTKHVRFMFLYLGVHFK